MSESKSLFDRLRSFNIQDDGLPSPEVRFLNYVNNVLLGLERNHVDFKEKSDRSHSTPNKDDKRNLAKAVSGFANSGGGVLIWGLEDQALLPKPITNVKHFLSNLSQLSTQVTDPPVSSIDIDLIECDITTQGEGYAFIYIPESTRPPHRVILSEKSIKDRYYIRSADSFIIAPHPILEDMFGRRPRPLLSLDTSLAVTSITARRKIDLDAYIEIVNNGRAVAKYPYLSVELSEGYRIYKHGIDGNGHFGLNRLAAPRYLNSATQCSFGGGSDNVIHPGSILSVFAIRNEIDINQALDALDDININYVLSADGIQSVHGTLTISGEEIQRLVNNYIQDHPEQFQ